MARVWLCPACPSAQALYLHLSPWTRTLYLDMDTLVVQPLPWAVFDLLQWYDFLAVPEPQWDGGYLAKMELGPEGEQQFNTGTLLAVRWVVVVGERQTTAGFGALCPGGMRHAGTHAGM